MERIIQHMTTVVTEKGVTESQDMQYYDTIDNNTFLWPVNLLKKFPASVNNTFLTLYILIGSGAVLINLFTIYVSFERKYRLLYKCCLISLACSDIILAIGYGLSMTPKFLQPAYDYWIQGEFMCSFIPFIQAVGMLANSMVLGCIAVDRYQMVVRAVKSTWDPSVWICVSCMTFIWGSSIGAAVPMLDHYSYRQAVLVDVKNNSFEFLPGPQVFYVCALMSDKSDTNLYFSIIFSLLFLPLFCVCIVLYSVIAKHIWYLRKPESSVCTSNTANTAVATEKKGEPYFKYNTASHLKPGRLSFKADEAAATTNRNADKKQKSGNTTVHTARKVRTFKVILTLMVLYFVFRMPIWIYKLVSLNPKIKLTDKAWMIVQNMLSLMIVINSVINPLMYCFLSQFLHVCGTVSEWARQKYLRIYNFFRNKISNVMEDKKPCQENDAKKEEDSVRDQKPISPQIPIFLMEPRSPYTNDVYNAGKLGGMLNVQTGSDAPVNSRSTVTTSNNSSPYLNTKVQEVHLPR